MKLGVDSLTLLTTHLYNKLIEQKTFSNYWKLFKLIALYKSEGDREDPKFYRPIAILCPLSKLLERETMFQMVKHMDTKNLWSNNMYK